MEGKINFSDMTKVACLMANDLKHIHLHAVGDKFDAIHSICGELYDEASSEMDWFAERALALGMEVSNFSDVKANVPTWKPVEDKAINWKNFVDSLDEIGSVYIEMLKNIEVSNTGDQSVIDGYIDIWDKEIEYKNSCRKQ
jgi:DNA-binding ferritin-like protein